MPESERKKHSNSKYDKDNWQYITFKARAGSKERIAEAANAIGLSINGFIRDAVSKAVIEAIGKPLEPTPEDAAKAMLLRILSEEVNKLLPLELGRTTRIDIETEYASKIENDPSMYEDISQVLSSDLPPKTKGKSIRDIENKKREEIQWVIRDNLDDY